MKAEDLPKELREMVDRLEYASSTIQNDIMDALDEAKDPQDFIEKAKARLESLKLEIQGYLMTLSQAEIEEIIFVLRKLV